MFEYQKTGEYFAQTQKGIEDTAAQEILELGADSAKPSYFGVYFKSSPEAMYKINYYARTVTRIMAPLSSFLCENENVLYEQAMEIPWDQFITSRHTFAVFANVSDSEINHSHYASLKLKDAVADYFRDKTGVRPNVDAKNPDLWINLLIRKNKATISIDTSGGSLHKRGYRSTTTEAPLQECLAAAILKIAQWDGQTPIIDPMCGSGTFLAEALMMSCNIPSAFRRKKFGFFHLPDFDRFAWREVQKDAKQKVIPYKEGLIKGFDIDMSAVRTSRSNLKNIPFGEKIKIDRRDFRELKDISPSLIVTNPPYGERLLTMDEAVILYKEFGDFLKQQCMESTAWILCGDKDLAKKLGLKTDQKIVFHNGPLETRLVKLELH